MANDDDSPLAILLRFAEGFLKRPVSVVEAQVLQALVQGKPLDLAKAAQQTVDQARQQTAQLIQADEQRTQQVLQHFVPADTTAPDPQAQGQAIQQLLTAAGAMAPAAASPPAVLPADDPSLKAMLIDLVQQEVKSAIESQMSGLAEKVEATLKKVTGAQASS